MARQDSPKRRATHNYLGQILQREPIVVEGLQIKPGEPVLVVLRDGRAFRHIYAGSVYGEHYTRAPLTTAEGMGPGPYKLAAFRHPDVLTAFIEAVDVEG